MLSIAKKQIHGYRLKNLLCPGYLAWLGGYWGSEGDEAEEDEAEEDDVEEDDSVGKSSENAEDDSCCCCC